MRQWLCALLLALPSLTWAEIRVVPKERTPEPNNVRLTLVYPHSGKVDESMKPDFQFRLVGYPIGTDTDFLPRLRELRYDPIGQSIRILIDNKLCIEMEEALIDALDNNAAEYFDQRITGHLNCDLTEGEHLIQAFPVRSYDESLKLPETFVASVFYVKTKPAEKKYDLSKPFLTYNQPYGTYVFSESRPILLDFLVKNCQISADGFKIRFSIDGKLERVLTAWIPYYIYGLTKGTHNIRLELMDPDGNRADGFYTDVIQTITIE